MADMGQFGQRQEMCGVGVTTTELEDCAGYEIILDNAGDVVRRIDMDFADSDNLKLPENPGEFCTRMTKEIAQVSLDPGTRTTLRIDQDNPDEGIEMRLSVTPTGETTTETIRQCGLPLTIASLPKWTDPHRIWTVKFDFEGSRNLALDAEEGGYRDGEHTLTVTVEPGSSWQFCWMKTLDTSKSSRLKYTVVCSWRPASHDGLGAPIRDILFCGAAMTRQKIGVAGGYVLYVDNPREEEDVIMQFDFRQSRNAELKPSSGNAGAGDDEEVAPIEIDGFFANTRLSANQALTPFVDVVAADKNMPVDMHYVLRAGIVKRPPRPPSDDEED